MTGTCADRLVLNMTVPRFYCPMALGVGETVDLPDAAAHHAARVLRLRNGDRLTLFNGYGGEYAAVIASVARDQVGVEIQSFRDIDRESPLAVTLVQAISGGDRMEITLQKAVELGVAGIAPVISHRSVMRLTGERAEKRMQRWQQIVIAACEQCGRNRVPPVAPILTLPEWLETGERAPSRWMLSPYANQSLRALAKPAQELQLLVGPEGGFTEEEEGAAMHAGFTGIRLGPRTLRTETAAPALLAAMQILWGDL